ncbi:hypothetical protein C1752_00226 [Acaryochloris thomasi RCC1774]|uniref:CHAT domain-containing protein n=1 Tax=Acaryochloris thomasi RCC1774 TaxID=1764569 RepID=A0A2W1JP19_9CYAN|nr:CHAT domain-containing protein [Acaryochloris thomasi]PZD74986.1 hypothetical protein C1752_00226 [Acaryochloris thomasi RCC1774]
MRSSLTSVCIGTALSGAMLLGAAQVLSSTPEVIPIDADSSQGIAQGRALYRQGQFSAAARIWQQEQERLLSVGDVLGHATVLNYLSLAYQQLGRLSEAEDAIATSLTLLQSSGPSQPYAQALNTQGRLRLILGQPEAALTSWQQATAVYQQLNDATGTAGSRINQAQAMEVLGLYRRACKTLLQASNLPSDCDLSTPEQWRSVLRHFEAQSDPQLKQVGLRTLGNSLRLAGQLDAAGTILQASLALPQTPVDRAITLLNLGKLEHRRYQHLRPLITSAAILPDAALAPAQQALAYWQQADLALSSDAQIQALALQSQLHRLSLGIELQQNQDAPPPAGQMSLQDKPQIDQVIAALRRRGIAHLPTSYQAVNAQLHFTQSLVRLGTEQRPLALTMANTALRQAQELQNTRAESHALGLLGQIYEQNQQWAESQRLTEQALVKAQTVRATDLAGQWQWQLGRIYQARRQRDAALNAYEAAIATLTNNRRDLLALDRNIQASFQADVEPVYRQFVDLLLQSPDLNNNARLQQAMEVIDTLQRVELENFLRCDLASIVSLAQQPLAADTALIYPILLSDRIEVIVRLPGGQIQRHTTRLPQPQVEATLAQLRVELEKSYISKDVHALSQQVYDWMIRPAESELAQIKNLVFVLDGSFRDLPMAALHDGDQYLVEKGYAVALVPGLQLLPSRSLSQTRLRALTFGLSETPPLQAAPPLPQVEEELTQISAYLPTRQHLNQAFTPVELQREIQSTPYSVVHIATHGQFSSDPEQTYLQTWNQRLQGSQLSSILQDRAPQGLQPIELLVLSACTTAAGDNRAILGLAGLAVQSGARSTMASLWSIGDRSTAQLMRHFYQTLTTQQGQITKAEALRQAQVKLLKTPGYEAPGFWAPFLLVGDWR